MKPGVALTLAAVSAAQRRAYAKAVRRWAAGQGIRVAERGRIAASVIAGYEAHMAQKRANAR